MMTGLRTGWKVSNGTMARGMVFVTLRFLAPLIGAMAMSEQHDGDGWIGSAVAWEAATLASSEKVIN